MSTPPQQPQQVQQPKDTENVKTQNPTSLGAGANEKVARKRPAVKPPLADVSMGRFLAYMVGGLVLLAAFYTWRFTVWAADVGGYWNLVTGHRNPPSTGPGEALVKAAGSAVSAHQSNSASASASSITPASAVSGKKGGNADVQAQIVNLAIALGVKPADLTNAIRPLIDPSVPNPAEAARQELELLKASIAAGGAVGGAGAAEKEAPATEGSLLGALGEAFLD